MVAYDNAAFSRVLKGFYSPQNVEAARLKEWRCYDRIPRCSRYPGGFDIDRALTEAMPGVTCGLRTVCGWRGRVFRQHLPGFVDPRIERFTVEDWDGDPMSIPWLVECSQRPEFREFYLLTEAWGWRLMMSMNDGTPFYVMGSIEGEKPPGIEVKPLPARLAEV